MPSVVGKNRKNEKIEISTNELRFRPSVYGILIEHDAVLLLPAKDGYQLPGGGVDIGERVEGALIREMHEETGLDVCVKKILYGTDGFYVTRRDDKYHVIVLYGICKRIGGSLSTARLSQHEKENMEVGLAEWVPIAQLEDIKIAHNVDFRPAIEIVYDQIKNQQSKI